MHLNLNMGVFKSSGAAFAYSDFSLRYLGATVVKISFAVFDWQQVCMEQLRLNGCRFHTWLPILHLV